MRKTAIIMAITAACLLGCGGKGNEDIHAQAADTVAPAAVAFDTLDAAPDTSAAAPDAALLDAVLPWAQPPVMKTGGKENRDVYLQSLDVAVEVAGNIASTRYTMVFKNRTDRILEGELTFPLPDGRSVSHYALDIDGKMREAVPVEKEKATRVFEEIERRRVDPGLLERVEGNNFRTRVYPIPRNGTRTVSIGYEEELTLENNLLYYRLPMAYTNQLEKFAVKATVLGGGEKPLVPTSGGGLRFEEAGENYAATLARENYRPSAALVFALPAPAGVPRVITQAARGDRYFLASAVPNMKARKKQWANELAIIWDVSLSGARRDLRRETEMLDIIFADKKDANAHLYFLNNKLVKKGEYKVVGGNWEELKNVLEAAVFDGGTDFSQINNNDIAGNEILFFSDGVSTLSDADFLKNNRINRPVHCVVSSANADYSAMKLTAGKTGGKFINSGALSPERLKAELLNETPLFLGAEHGKGVREVYPSVATPVHGNISIAGVAGKGGAELTLLFGFGGKVEKRIKARIDAKDAAGEGNIDKIWAQKKAAELDLEYEKNRAELAELGRQFGIVTRNTSLIVLETIDDYLTYDIEPPAELMEAYWLEKKQREEYWRKHKEFQGEGENSMLTIYKREWAEERQLWWSNFINWGWNRLTGGQDWGFYKYEVATDFFEALPEERTAKLVRQEETATLGEYDEDLLPEALGSGMETGPAITVKPVKKDNEYLSRLTGKTAEDYQIYLELRDEYSSSPAYYFDMSEWFYARGDRETALRVLTSIADLELENASLYRLLGYRFKEYGEYALEKFVCGKVAKWRPMDPQSFRDYALALADNGEVQEALDSLYALLTKPWPYSIRRRNEGMAQILAFEINRLIAKNPRLNTSKIDKRLMRRMKKFPTVDIRVVINWNMDNTDIDLHVKDPTGEDCFFRNNKTKIGGRISADITSGYGPEQFILKKAVKGKYQVYVNYYGDNQFTYDGPSTVMAEIYTKYAGKTEQRKVVTLQMSNAKRIEGNQDDPYRYKERDGKVEVAEFSF